MDGKPLGRAALHQQRTQMYSAFLSISLNSSSSACLLQSQGTKKPVCVDLGLRLLLVMLGL